MSKEFDIRKYVEERSKTKKEQNTKKYGEESSKTEKEFDIRKYVEERRKGGANYSSAPASTLATTNKNTTFGTETNNAYTSAKNKANSTTTLTSSMSDEDRKKRIKDIDAEIRNLNYKIQGLSRGASYVKNDGREYLTTQTEEAKKKIEELSAERKSLERVGTFTAAEMKQFEIEDAKAEKAKLPNYNPTARVSPSGVDAFVENAKAHTEVDNKIETLEREKELYEKISKHGDVVHNDSNSEDGFKGFISNPKGWGEDFESQWRANFRYADLTRDADKAMSEYIKNPTEENKQLAYAYDAFVKAYQKNNEKALDDENVKASWLTKSAAGYLPQFSDQIVPELIGGTIGTMLFGKTGGSIAAGLATYSQMYDVMRGSIYRTLLAEGVDEQTALQAAEDEALISSLIESGGTAVSWLLLGGSNALKAVGDAAMSSVAKGSASGATKYVANKFLTQSAKQAAQPLWKTAVKGGLGIVGDALSEYGEEYAQGAVSIANRERATSGEQFGGKWDLVKGGSKVIADAMSGDIETRAELHEQGMEGFKIGLMFGGTQSVVNNTVSAFFNAKTIKEQNEVLDFTRNDKEALDALIESGKASGEGTVSAKIATEIETARNNGKEVTRDQVKRLIASTDVYINAEEKAAEAVSESESEKDNTPINLYAISQKLDARSQNNEPIYAEDVIRATGFGNSGAELVATYSNVEGETFSRVVAEAKPSYMAGMENPDLDASKMQNVFKTPIQLDAFKAGQIDRKADAIARNEGLNNVVVNKESGFATQHFLANNLPSDVTSSQVQTLDLMAKALGVKSYVATGLKGNAELNRAKGEVPIDAKFEREIKIDGKTQKVSIVFHAAHEMAVHRVLELAPEEGSAFMYEMYKQLAGSEPSTFTLADKKRNDYASQGVEISLAEAMEEVTASNILKLYNYNEAKFHKAIENIVNGTNTKAKQGLRKYIEYLTDIIRKIGEFLTGKSAKDRAEIQAELNEIRRLRDMFETAFAKAVESKKAIEAKQNSDTNSAKNLEIKINEEYNGNISHSLKNITDEGYTTEGTKWAIANGLLTSGEQADFWENISELNHNSYYKNRSKSGQYIIDVGRKLVFTNGDIKATTISSIIEFNDGYEANINDFKEWIINEERDTAQHGESLQIIEIVQGEGYVSEHLSSTYRTDERETGRRKGNDSTATNQKGREVVSKSKKSFSLKDSEGNTLTEAQQEFFKDSKVRDENGNLLVVYHGSPSKFTVFNHKYLNVNGNSHGRGFYFTEKRSLAEGYERESGQLLKGYLNITNPLSEDKVTIKKADLLKLIKATCKEEAQEYVNDGDYDSVSEAIRDTWISNYVNTYETSMDNAYREVANNIYSANTNDVEMIAELTNAGRNDIVLKLTHDIIGYDGVIYMADDGTHEFVSLVSEQFKSVTNTAPTSDPDIRYSLKDSEYLELAKDTEKNEARLNVMVKEAAKQAGYNSPKLYHGTSSFGFTEFDLSKMDDKRTIFLTSNKKIASTYSGVNGEHKIYDVYTKDIESLSAEDVAKELNKLVNERYKDTFEEYYYNYSYYNLEKLNKLINTVNNGLDELKVEVEQKIGEYADKMALDFDEATAKVHRQLVSLKERLDKWDYQNLSTPIYLLIHHTDVFKDNSAKYGDLEANVRLMNGLKTHQDITDGVVVEESLGRYSIEIMNKADAVSKLKSLSKKGNYALYAKMEKPLMIDGRGQNWNNIRRWTDGLIPSKKTFELVDDDEFYYLKNKETGHIIKEASVDILKTDKMSSSQTIDFLMNKYSNILAIKYENVKTTREIAKVAKDMGYDSVVIKNITDNGGRNYNVGMEETADIYMLFDSNNIKSADPVTYDSYGKVIPLSERFNEQSNDIRYSLKDSEGKVLTEAQQEFFKDSKIRDKDGNLLVMYHGTTRGGFTVFGGRKDYWYFTNSKKYAYTFEGRKQNGQFYPYTKERIEKGQATPQRYKVYLNVTNPYITDIDTVEDALYWDNSLAGLLREKGYDALMVEDMSQVVVLNANQIKNTDNKNPTSDSDIRYSLKGTNDINTKDVKRMAEIIEHLKGEFETTKFAKADQKTLAKMTRGILKDYSSQADFDETFKAIDELYLYMANGENGHPAVWEDVYYKAYEVAQKIVENALVVDDSMYNEYKHLRDYLRNTPMKFYAGFDDVPSLYENFNEFRRMNMGRLKFTNDGMSIDSVYQELSSLYPEFFNSEEQSNTADQLEMIVDVLDNLKPTEINQFDGQIMQVSTDLANDLISRFFDIPQAKPTFADKAERRVVDAKIKGSKKVEAVRQQKDEKIKKLIESQRSKTKKLLEKAKTSKTKAVEKEKVKRRESLAKMSESQKVKVLRAKIIRHTSDLNKKLLNPTDNQHIPHELQGAVAKLLECINLESNYTYDTESHSYKKNDEGLPSKRTEAFEKLRAVYQNIASSVVVDPDLMSEGGLLSDVISLASKRIVDMTSSELDTVWQTIRAIEASVSTANKLFSQGKFATILETAEKLKEDNAGKKRKTELVALLGEGKTLTTLNMLTPETYLHCLGEAGDSIFRMLRDAQDKHITIMKEVSDFTHETLKDVNVNSLEKTIHTVKLGGEEVQLSTAQLMELYVLMKREQAVDHIMIGGILPDATKGKGVKLNTRSEPIRNLTLSEISEALSVLTDEQRQIADKLQKFVSNVLSGYGNEASMQVYNYEKFLEENYWTIRTNKQEIVSDVGKDTAVTTVANKGMAKGTKPHANTSVRIGSIFDTFAAHSSDMATYAAWLGTSEDVNRIRNFVFWEDGVRTGTVKGILDTVHGIHGSEYLQKLLTDIAIGVKGTDNMNPFDKFIGHYKAASVGANLRVIIQQPTAILRALDMIDARYLAEGAIKPLKGWSKAKKYAPIAQWKDWGHFDINTGRQMKDVLFDNASLLEKTKQVAMLGASLADSLAWGQLWNAVEAETKAKHKELEVGTDAYYETVAKRFTEIVDHTQVVDGILQRSQIMRSPDALTKMATSFMGEPTKQYNMAASAVYDAKNLKGDARKKAIARLGRTAVSLAVAGIVNACAQSIIDAMRDDDREKDYWERWTTAFVGDGEETTVINSNLGDTVNPFNYVPFAKDVVSILQGYDVKRMDTESITKTFNAAQNMYKAVTGTGKYTIAEASAQLFAEIARMYGLPVANVKRDIKSLVMSIADATDNALLQYRIEKAMLDINYAGNSKNFMDIIFTAYMYDKSAYNIIHKDMLKYGYSAEKIESGIEARKNKADGGEKKYKSSLEKVKQSQLWKSATATQRKDAESDLRNFLTSTSEDMGNVRAEALKLGIDETEYTLWQLAKEMVSDGKDGVNAKEKVAAVKLLDLPSDAEWGLYLLNNESKGATYAYENGIDSDTYAAFIEMLYEVDKPSKSGKYGTFTQDEATEAVSRLDGLSRQEKAALWQSVNTTWKKNPYR